MFSSILSAEIQPFEDITNNTNGYIDLRLEDPVYIGNKKGHRAQKLDKDNWLDYVIIAPHETIEGFFDGAIDKNGNIIGIVQAKHTQAENAGYAIKASYIRNLVELLPTTISLPKTNQLTRKTLPQQVEKASKAVCVIIVNGD